VLADVEAVTAERLSRPGLAAREPIVRRVEPDEIHRQLAAHDELLDKRGDRCFRRARTHDRACDFARADLPEVEIG
jgi:hypothetical protein